MTTVVLVIHLIVATSLVGVILIQRSEGGALGMGGGTFGGLMTARGSANLLTRTTAILAACFILTSLVLAILASHGGRGRSILDAPDPAPVAPSPVQPAPAPAAPPAPGEPSAPVAQ